MSELSTMNNTAIASYGADPFSAYGQKVGRAGLFLTFKNGEFLYGQDGKMLPLGTRLAANVAGLRIGWKRWFASRVTDDLLTPLVDMQPMQTRNSLGDLDQALWEKDNEGKPRDPWQITNELIFVDADGQEYIYATASKGGIGALGRLCEAYGKLYRQKPGMVPIIELGNDSYPHPIYKKTYVPVFNLVDWAPENALDAIVGEPAAQAPLLEQERVAPPSQGSQRVAPPIQVASAPSPAPAGAQTQDANGGVTTTTSPSRRARF